MTTLKKLSKWDLTTFWSDYMKYTCTLENLNCAHCAEKIENKIAETVGYENVSFNFATKKLSFYSDKPEVVTELQAICDSIEDGVNVVDNNAEAHEHHHGESSNAQKILLAVSIVLGVAALVLHLAVKTDYMYWVVFALSAAAALLSGYETFIHGVKNALKLRIDETTLMTIAVIAAFCLGEFTEGAMVSILFSIGEFIEDIAVDNSRRNIEKLSKIRPDTATIIRNGREETVPAETVKAGSEIIVKPHERIPLDGVVKDSFSTVDNSALTGESVPVDVSDGSEVMSGAINGERVLRLVTTKEFGDSTATRILNLVEDAAAQKGSNEKLISRFASIYTPIVIGIAVLISVIPPLVGLGSFGEWIYRGLTVLVASCPCAIVISVPLSYYAGIGSASSHGVLIKGGKFLEALAKADSFAFDKTGTLTTGELKIEKVYSCSEFSDDEIINLAAACEKYSSHPIALSIKRSAGKNLPVLNDYSETAGSGISAVYKGKRLSCGNDKFVNGKIPSELKNANVFLVYDNRLIGAISVSDKVRPEAAGVIDGLKKLGAKHTVMLTGDSKSNAEKAASHLPLTEFKAELMPSDKVSEINALKAKSKAVCFVGDGINDAPVLSASDCGTAMGLGSEAAIEASDMVLSSGTLEHLPTAVKIARKAINTVKTNITFALAIKAAVIILAALGMATMWMSVLADTGVCVICVLYTSRLLRMKYK